VERQYFEWIRRTEFDRNWPVMFGSVARCKGMTKFIRRFLSLFCKSLGLDRRFATRTTRKPESDSVSLLTCSITYLRVNGFTYSKRLSVVWRTVYTNSCKTQYTKNKLKKMYFRITPTYRTFPRKLRVTKKSSVIWSIIPCRPLKIKRRSIVICCLHLKGRRISQEWNRHENMLPASRWFLPWLIIPA
jgi:hypothetical protein